MKKFFAAIIFALLLLLVESSAQSMPVQLFDHSVDYIISDLRTACREELGISLWGTEYYTYQGARRCELHFGNSDNNTIRFRLNNDNSVVRVLVSVWVPDRKLSRAVAEAGEQCGFIAGAILYSIGLTLSEIESLFNKATDDFYDTLNRNPYTTHYHESTSIWCPRIRRYVVLDLEGSPSMVEFYIYAHD
ncbi:MAG: hypothetical protein IJ685_11620 [Selenomonadaceae bacterium]|nr:hypothetical protein [Selenomonadaceae bacterium]